MFTVDDLIGIAVQIEKNGEETYRRASLAVADQETAALLSWMADEEGRHRRWFATLPRDSRPLSAHDLAVEEMGRALLQDILRGSSDFLHDRKALEEVKEVAEALALASRFEEETVVFYEFLRALLEDGAAIARLEEIIAEERRHRSLLEKMCQNPDVTART
jgi:rubrerythrin